MLWDDEDIGSSTFFMCGRDMMLFLHEGEHRRNSEALVIRALTAFTEGEKQAGPVTGAQHAILRTKSGKPYFDGDSARFSVSHTGKLWACLMARFDVGLDIQEVRPVRCDALAARVFTSEEREFTLRHGAPAFFEIWARKEACVKYLGTGIAQDFRRFSVVHKDALADEIDLCGERCFLFAFEVKPGIKCAICSKENDFELCTKVLN